MKNELKTLYKKDADLALEVAKVLGYKIESKKKRKKKELHAKPKQNPIKGYNNRYKEIVSYIASLNKFLKTHAKKFTQEPSNWGFVGDLGHVKELLKEITDFLG